eukprot:TRINITY_DN91221_c0_g1_i1.p1 TRINITY_DN91221_c0_g1~~TRINITY_DN91221_c0_g1_i1.p1  ORF type:complete len:725 (+),score=110.98 TRINITY_DN91221_c0_g1_i1:51-2177(+)
MTDYSEGCHNCVLSGTSIARRTRCSEEGGRRRGGTEAARWWRRQGSWRSSWLAALVGAVSCHRGLATSPSSCATVPMPPLPECFDSQPMEGSSSCYRRVTVGGVESVVCAYDRGGRPLVNRTSVLECRNSTWQPGPSTGFECRAAPRSVWRLKAMNPTTRGWWVHEVKFYTDTSCLASIPQHEIKLMYDVGPAGSSVVAAEDAMDGNLENFWRAPCMTSSSVDVCGCRTFMGEGFSNELQTCVPNHKTDGVAIDACVERIAAGVTDSAEVQQGCPGGAASIGIHLASAKEIQCIRLKQYRSQAFVSNAISLEAWGDGSWSQVKTFSDLQGGVWQALRVRNSCGPYEIAGIKWAQLLESNNVGSHGDVLTIQCIGGTDSTTVTCEDGEWSRMGYLKCNEPVLPSGARTSVTFSTAYENEGDPLFDGLLVLVAIAFGLVSLLGSCYTFRWYMRRRSWRRLVKYGAPVPEESKVLTKAQIDVGPIVNNGSAPYVSRFGPRTESRGSDAGKPRKVPMSIAPAAAASAPPRVALMDKVDASKKSHSAPPRPRQERNPNPKPPPNPTSSSKASRKDAHLGMRHEPSSDPAYDPHSGNYNNNNNLAGHSVTAGRSGPKATGGGWRASKQQAPAAQPPPVVAAPSAGGGSWRASKAQQLQSPPPRQQPLPPADDTRSSWRPSRQQLPPLQPPEAGGNRMVLGKSEQKFQGSPVRLV